jgi:hypothetical protein
MCENDTCGIFPRRVDGAVDDEACFIDCVGGGLDFVPVEVDFDEVQGGDLCVCVCVCDIVCVSVFE